MPLEDDIAVTQPNIRLPKCTIPGCLVVETGAKETCVTWGKRRLCYPHFADFTLHPLASKCSEFGKAPTEAEWTAFAAWSSKAREAA